MSQFNIIRTKAPWYFLSNILKGLSGFILLPLYTRYLNPEQYGQFQTLRSLAEFLPLIIAFSLHSAFSRLYFDHKEKDHQKLTSLYSSIYWFLLGWGAIIYILSIAVSVFFIENLVKLPMWPFIPLAFLAPVLNQLSILGDSLLRLKLESRMFSIISTSSFFISSAFNVFLLMYTDLKVEACLVGYVVINFVPFVYYTYYGFKTKILRFTFNWEILKAALKFSLPFQIAATASWIIGYSDRLILSHYGTIAMVGSYTIAVTISKVLYMLNDSIHQIHSPMAMADLSNDTDTASKNIIIFLEKFIPLLTIGYLGISLFAPEFIYFIFPESYSSSIRLIPILAAVYVVSGLYRPYTTLLYHYKKNWALSNATIAMAICGTLLNFIFIPIWTDKAAAVSQLLSIIIYTIFVIYYSQKTVKLNINFFKVLAPFACAFVITIVFINQKISAIFFILKALIILIFCTYYMYSFRSFWQRNNHE